MSEQFKEEDHGAHDRIDLLVMRVKDLEELAQTQKIFNDMIMKTVREQGKNIDKILEGIVLNNKILNEIMVNKN